MEPTMSHSAPTRSGLDTRTVKLAQELLDAIPSSLQIDQPPTEAYDALADLFLSNDEAAASVPPQQPNTDPLPFSAIQEPRSTPQVVDEPPHQPAPIARAPIEALILGHLPVLASVWVMQYAKSLAHEKLTPVALLRFNHDHVTLDLVGDETQARGCLDTHATLQSAIQAAGKLAGTWLIRLAETDEPTVFEQENIDTVTLLTGANEAAIVASYHTVKAIASAWNPDQPGPEPTLKLSVMGATPEKARDAWTRLNRATRTFLDRKVQLGLCPDHVSAGKSRTIYSGDSDEDLASVLRWVHHARTADHAPTRAPAPIQILPPAPPTIEPLDIDPRPTTPSTQTHAAGALEPAPVLQDAQDPATESQEDLARKLGLNPIDARCPYARHVELALDQDGRLHILAAATQRSHANEQTTLHALTTVGAWAKDHAQIIAMTCQGHTTAVQHAPVIHLLTDRPQNVRRLLDANIRIHLLASIDPNQDWYCTALN